MTEAEQSTRQQPRGFPDGYEFHKGDWLCPSPGCEGYVTSKGISFCVNCGRNQPHPLTLTALASDPFFRCGPCRLDDCSGRLCSFAHAQSELRNAAAARKLKIATHQVPGVPAPTSTQIEDFAKRWNLSEENTNVLTKLSVSLCDAVLQTFSCENGKSVPEAFSLCIKDFKRPQLFFVSGPTQVHAALCRIISENKDPVGLACSVEGNLAVAVKGEIFVFQLRALGGEDLVLLYLAMTTWGCTVTHSLEDISRLQNFAPADLVALTNRIRMVSTPSEIPFVAEDAWNALVDRALAAKIDAFAPAPSGAASPSASPASTAGFRN